MKVKIKTWEQMGKEFGLDELGSIACKGSFVCYMEKEMPPDRIEVNKMCYGTTSTTGEPLCDKCTH